MAPAQRPPRRRRLRAGLRSSIAGLAAPAAACCAIAGALLLVLPTTATASLRHGHIEVGSMELDEVGPTPGGAAVLFQGAASYALTEPGDGSARGAAAWTASGHPSTGTCELRRAGARLVEDCSFAGGTGAITCVDVLDTAAGSSWQRTYADGVRVTIVVPQDGAAIPVPFPIGR